MTVLPPEMLASREAVRAHCYRMLAHPQDAEDAAQDTFVRAVRSIDGFEGRSSAKTWLITIATRVCLDRLASRKRRRMPTETAPSDPTSCSFDPTDPDEWVAPYPLAMPPEEQVATRERVDLGLVTLLQKLPPRQRAAILLAEVFDWTAPEVADALGTSAASVNSALQRARATLSRGTPARATVDPDVVRRYREAFERYDVDAMVALLTEDVVFEMPPIPVWFRGRDHVRQFLRGPGAECRGSVVVPVEVSGAPGFAQYRAGGAVPWALVALETDGARISALHHFLDTETLFPLFGLPHRWPDEEKPMKSHATGSRTL